MYTTKLLRAYLTTSKFRCTALQVSLHYLTDRQSSLYGGRGNASFVCRSLSQAQSES